MSEHPVSIHQNLHATVFPEIYDEPEAAQRRERIVKSIRFETSGAGNGSPRVILRPDVTIFLDDPEVALAYARAFLTAAAHLGADVKTAEAGA